jgi:hypothetical protein
MTVVKSHSMALKDGDDTKIEIEILNPATSTAGWVCRLTISMKGGQCLSVPLNREEAVTFGITLFKIVAES